MARMMNALQLALGSVGSGIQGYAQARAAREEQERLAAAFERQQQQDEEGRQVRLGELMSQGFEPVADVRRKQQDAVGAAGSLIGSALNAASGNAALPMPSESAQASLAGGYAGARPSRTITFGGQELSLRETQPERQERLSRVAASMSRAEKEQERLEKSTEARRVAEAKSADMADAEAAWVGAGLSPAKARVAARTGAKYGDVYMSDKDLQSLGISRAQLKLAQDRFGFDQAKVAFDQEKSAGETPRGEMMNGLQAMGKARAATALNLLETNTKIMKQFEDDLRDGKLQMTGVQVEAARKALAGTPGSAIAEEALNKGNFLIDKNPALLRYIRAGKSIASAVREITPRGGSNLMMQMEIALSGIGPGGTDPESLAQVDAFRNDLLMGVRTGVEAMTGKPSGSTEGGGTVNRGSKPAMTIDEWMDANQQGSNESDVAYIARGKAATGGK
jgi:hypothetical protein